MTGRDVHSHDMPHDPLDSFLDDLRSAAADTPAPAVGDALATLFREGAAPVVSTAPRRGPRWSLRGAVAGAVAGVALSGLGIAGALPGPVQHGVATVVNHVGVQLPDPETTTTTAPPPTSTVPAIRPSTVPRPAGGDHTTTTVKGEQRHDDGVNGDHRGRSGDHGSTTTSTTSTEHRDDEGTNGSDKDGHGGRIPTGTTVVRSEDGSQAASQHPNRGGQSE